MTNVSTISLIPPAASMETARQDVRNSFERFCLTQLRGRKTPNILPARATAVILSAPVGRAAASSR
jgi:hypothetical protein